jgi:hypothetical protein
MTKITFNKYSFELEEARQIYNELHKIFGKPVQQPFIPEYTDSTGSWPGLPYKVTCVDAILHSGKVSS